MTPILLLMCERWNLRDRLGGLRVKSDNCVFFTWRDTQFLIKDQSSLRKSKLTLSVDCNSKVHTFSTLRDLEAFLSNEYKLMLLKTFKDKVAAVKDVEVAVVDTNPKKEVLYTTGHTNIDPRLNNPNVAKSWDKAYNQIYLKFPIKSFDNMVDSILYLSKLTRMRIRLREDEVADFLLEKCTVVADVIKSKGQEEAINECYKIKAKYVLDLIGIYPELPEKTPLAYVPYWKVTILNSFRISPLSKEDKSKKSNLFCSLLYREGVDYIHICNRLYDEVVRLEDNLVIPESVKRKDKSYHSKDKSSHQLRMVYSKGIGEKRSRVAGGKDRSVDCTTFTTATSKIPLIYRNYTDEDRPKPFNNHQKYVLGYFSTPFHYHKKAIDLLGHLVINRKGNLCYYANEKLFKSDPKLSSLVSKYKYMLRTETNTAKRKELKNKINQETTYIPLPILIIFQSLGIDIRGGVIFIRSKVNWGKVTGCAVLQPPHEPSNYQFKYVSGLKVDYISMVENPDLDPVTQEPKYKNKAIKVYQY